MFQPVSNSVDFPALERDVLAFWRRTDAFGRLRALRASSPKRFSFIDGPITANNPMGVHHAWGRTYKDVWQRYKAMQGFNQRWQNGFDCQGLWVEVNVEKELGFTSKKDIEDFGIVRFINLCKQRVLNNAATQTEQSVRLGYWMDWNDATELRMLAEQLAANPDRHITLERGGRTVHGTVEQLVGRLGMEELGGSYFTFSDENNYQIWSFLKECHKNGWIYRGTDSIPWCPRCATGISQHEIDTEGYKDREDPAITVRMRLTSFETNGHAQGPGARAPLSADNVRAAWVSDDARRQFEAVGACYLLAWTTTPWTLPANVMAAVGPKLSYALVAQTHRDGERALYVLSKGTLKMLRGEYELLGEISGENMVGWKYQGMFDELPAWIDAHKTWQDRHGLDGDRVFEHGVIPWDEVGEAEGTGIVHIAPGCGPEDHHLGKLHGSPMVAPIDEEGIFLTGFGPLAGMAAHDVPDKVEASLREKGFFYKREKYIHRYAHCWRCSSPLVYRMVDEWYISMDQLRYDMMNVSEQINWIPEFGKERELDWLRNMHDWMISKKRYWGLALPIWEYADGSFEVIGSYEELKSRAVEGWEQFDGHTPHRPWIDRVKIRHPVTGLLGERVPDVGNPWLDAGIVAYSTLRYRTDKDYWATWFPADFITESFPGQFRNWFYSLIAMSTVLEEHMPTRTVLGFATLFDEKGEAMHKSKGNAIEFNEAADKAGADSMRWLYARQRYDDNLLFGYNKLNDVRRQFILPLWNVYAFFTTYANADGWTPGGQPQGGTPPAAAPNPLDVWISARLAEATRAVAQALDAYDARAAALALETFVDDLSNWYVRRSRRRFWKTEHDGDKNAAYATLYEVLVTLARLLAPFTPFLSEAMWLNLAHGETPASHASAPARAEFSVHHTAFPQPRELTEGERGLLRDVAVARQAVNLGHSLRATSKVKVRQPLARIMVVADAPERAAITQQADTIADELNVKAVEFAPRESDLVSYRVLPDLKKLGRKLGPALPRVKEGLAALDPAAVARAVKAGQAVTVDGVTLQPDEVLVQAQPKEGLVVAGEAGLVVALDTQVNESLLQEGLAREVVRRLNDLRKLAGLSVGDRIIAEYRASERLAGAIRAFSRHIQDETLATALLDVQDVTGATLDDDFDGESVRLGVRKAVG